MNRYDLSKDTETALGILGAAIGTAIATYVVKWIDDKLSKKGK